MEQTDRQDTYEREVFFSNVSTVFRTSHPIDLKLLVERGLNMRHMKNMVTVYLKTPIKVSANIFASGKVVCKGAQSQDEAFDNCKAVAKLIKNLGFKVEMRCFRITNVVCTIRASTGGINLHKLAREFEEVDFNSESRPYALWKMDRAELRIYSSGEIVVTARSEDLALEAISNFVNTASALLKNASADF